MSDPAAPSSAEAPADPAAAPPKRRTAPKRTKAATDRGRPFPAEVELYAPVKRFLESRGYDVKGEVRGCDVVAVRAPDEPPVIVELKLSFTLAFVLQGVDRLALTDHVYLAVPAPTRRADARAALTPDHQGVRRLCRRLGLGLLAVYPETRRPRSTDRVEVILDPDPQRLPRRNKTRARLVLPRARPPPRRPHPRRQDQRPARRHLPTARRRCAAPTCSAATAGGRCRWRRSATRRMRRTRRGCCTGTCTGGSSRRGGGCIG
jgi:hypothetical protein